MFPLACTLLVLTALAFIGSLIFCIFSVMDDEGLATVLSIIAAIFFLTNLVFLIMFLNIRSTKEYSEMEYKFAQQKYERVLESTK